MIDGDGSGGNLENDPYFQSDTSLHYQGKALNARKDIYIVVPPQIEKAVKGIVLGCQALVVDTMTGKETDAVVGDTGPRNKIGEMSIACAKVLGIPSSPISGGENRRDVTYQIYPGVAAEVNGKKYSLHPI